LVIEFNDDEGVVFLSCDIVYVYISW
jgi:hypothetical protein